MRKVLIATGIALVALVVAVYYFQPPSTPTVDVALTPLVKLPIEIPIEQRTTVDIPGSAGDLRLTIDDITAGQVMITVIAQPGTPLLGPVSLRQAESDTFVWQATTYQVQVTRLTNNLIGDDSAVVTILADTANLSEAEKIDALVAEIAALDDAVFIRNGSEYAAAEAASHLQQKREAAGSRITTARDFIDQLASKSSLSGEAYTIRFADGRTQVAGEFLRDELGKIESEQDRRGTPAQAK